MPFVLTKREKATLEKGLAEASATALRFFLKYSELPVGSPSKQDLVDRIWTFVNNGKIELANALDAVRGIQENKNKRVYFYRVAHAALAKVSLKFDRSVKSLRDAYVRDGVSKGELSYSYVSDSSVRLSFSELQQDVEVDIHAKTFRDIDVTNVIVAQLDRADGWLTISYDPPSRLHSHGSSDAYYRHYKNLTKNLLGVDFTTIDLCAALDALQTSPLVRPKHVVVDTDDGPVQLTGEIGDCRDMGVTPDVERFVRSRDRGHYEWLTNQEVVTLGARFGAHPRIVPLLRGIRTDIMCDPGLVRFSGDCLANEVDYVLSEIKSIA